MSEELQSIAWPVQKSWVLTMTNGNFATFATPKAHRKNDEVKTPQIYVAEEKAVDY